MIRKNKAGRTLILAASLAMAMAAAPNMHAAELSVTAAIDFNIAPQTLSAALLKYSEQSGVQVTSPSKLLDGLMSSGLKGSFQAKNALAQLLSGTSLSYDVVDEKTVAIRSIGDKKRKIGANNGVTQGDAISIEQYMQLAQVGEDAASTVTQKAKKTGASQNNVEEMVVEETKIKPYSDANIDIPRTINDPQPYYIFNSETIDRSGATNIEDFLKQRLTMNTVALTTGQVDGINFRGNASTINLRGVGEDKTLILVNGRRIAGANLGNDTGQYQTDLNGIPLSSIERIEVMPSSASGIYGGSALGGVVNVILKKDYTGGELRATYDNIWDTDAPRRKVTASYGAALFGGKTNVSASFSWADEDNMVLQDRLPIFQKNLATLLRNSPTFMFSSSPWIGSVPNIKQGGLIAVPPGTPGAFGPYPAAAPYLQYGITATNSYLLSVPDTTPLVLKNGVSLNSNVTYVAPGTVPGTSTAGLYSSLLGNAGQWNMDFPSTTQFPTGLNRPFGITPAVKSFQGRISQRLTSSVELFADLFFSDNRSASVFNGIDINIAVPPNAPTSPFTSQVVVTVPHATDMPFDTRSQTRSGTLGALAQLPGQWTGGIDYTWTENRFNHYYRRTLDSNAFGADIMNGTVNPFVDSLQYPIDFQRYVTVDLYKGVSRLDALAARAAGPLPVGLPWGVPTMAVGLERRHTTNPEREYEQITPLSPQDNYVGRYFNRKSTTESAYMEVTVPLVAPARFPLMHGLDLQLAGRSERHVADIGAVVYTNYYGRTPPVVSLGGYTVNGQPYFSEASYSPRNYTLGLKYQPLEQLTLRVSKATAFLPPTPNQLNRNPLPSATTTQVDDPVRGQRVAVYTLSGGNPDLTPQNSQSFNAGVIWEPRWTPLAGLRVNAEYYRIEQFDAIGSFSAQQIVDRERNYPDRVVRNATGAITLVDTSSVNLYHRETEGWDLSADYAVDTKMGRFRFNALESIILHLKDQTALTEPEYDSVGFPSDGGAAKYKANATLSFERRNWTLGWTSRYFGSYKQYGAEGGPNATRRRLTNPNAALFSFYFNAQRSWDIPAQIYHDLFFSYSVGSGAKLPARSSSLVSDLLHGVTLQLGINNVFATVPPFDAYFGASNSGAGNKGYFMSPYGDVRLRSYSISARKSF